MGASPPEEMFVPPQGPPQGPPPDAAIFQAMGVDGITRMLEDFYRNLASSDIAAMFPAGEQAMLEAAHKSALFFVGVCGGPPLYAQTIGPPRMRARHLPFAIDAHAREVWLECWEQVLAQSESKYGFPPEHLPGFRTFLIGFSAWMVNRA